MDASFKAVVESLVPSLEMLMRCQPTSEGKFEKGMPAQGVYLFSEEGRPLYVGRSNSMRARYGRHTRASAHHNMAAFAFRLAREETGNLKASYAKGALSRAGLVLDPVFSDAFRRAKDRIRKMEYRFVEERDQTRQAILEIYCAVALATPYNDFRTH